MGYERIAVIGSSGALGRAFVDQLKSQYPSAELHAFSSSSSNTNRNVIHHSIDYRDEFSLEKAAQLAAEKGPLDLVIIATGILHHSNMMPEKSLKELSAEKFEVLFRANAILPALIAKHFLPKLNRKHRSVFAALSARVGSISDNSLGGWYAYRASKAALNMLLRNAAIETARSNKQAIIVGLHPGTVDSLLSKPFQRNVASGKLFTPDYAVKKMIDVLQNLELGASGRCFAWDGSEIFP